MTAGDPAFDPVAASGSGGMRGRVLWTMATQGLSSGSNFLLSAVVLAVAPARSFAVFSIVLTTYLLLLQFARYVIGIPVLIGQAGPAPDGDAAGPAPDGDAASSTGLAALAGLAVCPALLVTAGLWREGAPELLLLALAIPFLLTQDALRHVAIASGRSQLAVAADGTWVGIQVVGSAVVLAAGSESATLVLGIWCAAGAVSAVVLAGLLQIRPLIAGAGAWLRRNGELCRRVAFEFVVNSGSYFVLSYGLLVSAGAQQLGNFRAAQTLFGPASVLLLGGAALGVPESVRIRRDSSATIRFSLRLSAALTILSLVCGMAVYALLPVAGPHLFSSWRAVRALMPWLTLFGAALGAGAGPIVSLRAAHASRWLLHARALTSAVSLLIGLPASAWLGAKGCLIGLGLSECLLSARAWRRLLRTLP